MHHKEYTLSLNEKELRVLLSALGKRPFEEVYELIEKIVTSTYDKDMASVTVPGAKKNNAK